MLRQIVLHTFSSGIYTTPFPSCLHLHIYITESLPPTVLHCSCQLICWPSSEAELIAGQRTAAKKNIYRHDKNIESCMSCRFTFKNLILWTEFSYEIWNNCTSKWCKSVPPSSLHDTDVWMLLMVIAYVLRRLNLLSLRNSTYRNCVTCSLVVVELVTLYFTFCFRPYFVLFWSQTPKN